MSLGEFIGMIVCILALMFAEFLAIGAIFWEYEEDDWVLRGYKIALAALVLAMIYILIRFPIVEYIHG